MFAKHSWYFRNALVRANYKNAIKGIDYSPVFLERFFRNLLLGEQWDLRNRYLHINPPAEWKEQPNLAVPSKLPTSTPTSFIPTNNKNIIRLVNALGEEQLSVKVLMERISLKDRENFLDYSLNPSMNEGYIRMLYPDSPRHPRQKYMLTVKGLALYNSICHGDS